MSNETVSLEVAIEVVLRNGPTFETIAGLCNMAVEADRMAQQQMQPCAGRNCGSTNPNLHSAECLEDYEKATGMATKPVGGVLNERGEVDWISFVPPAGTFLYTAPPPRQPLTEEHAKFVIALHTTLVNAHYDEHKNTNIICEKTDSLGLVRAIEAAHGITGESK